MNEEENRRWSDNSREELVEAAASIARKRTRISFIAAIVAVVLTVALLSVLGFFVYQELREQNATLHESIVTAQELSERNQEILERQRSTEQKLAKNLLRDNRRARQQLRTMRREHNIQIRLIRGIIRRAGGAELLEDLPGVIRGGDARRQPPS